MVGLVTFGLTQHGMAFLNMLRRCPEGAADGYGAITRRAELRLRLCAGGQRHPGLLSWFKRTGAQHLTKPFYAILCHVMSCRSTR